MPRFPFYNVGNAPLWGFWIFLVLEVSALGRLQAGVEVEPLGRLIAYEVAVLAYLLGAVYCFRELRRRADLVTETRGPGPGTVRAPLARAPLPVRHSRNRELDDAAARVTPVPGAGTFGAFRQGEV